MAAHRERTVMTAFLRFRSLIWVLGCAGLAGGYALAQEQPVFDPLFDAVSNCFKPKQSGWTAQLAQISPELKPVDAPQAPLPEQAPPPLWQGLGSLNYPIGTSSREA